MRSIFAAAVVLAGMSTMANADVIMGSAPAFGGSSQNVVVCYYVNVGTTAVTFTSSQIFAEPGFAVAEVSEFCAGNIAPGQRCRTVSVSPIITNGALWCRAAVSSKGGLRGRMEIRNSFNTVLTTEDIR